MPRRVVLDTDIGTDVDDALALALALASPEIELVAVTTVAGDTMLRARIAARLLALAGRDDIPVHPGCAHALSSPGGFRWFGHEGAGITAGSRDAASDEPAVDALIRLFRPDDDLELVAIGPLTNVAAALAREPRFASRVPRLTVMGGWLRGARVGDTLLPPSVDYNLCSDAVAAVRVLSAGIPTRLVSADATVQVWLTDTDVTALERASDAVSHALARTIRIWTPVQRRLFAGLDAPPDADNAAFLHDPLALACVHDESFCRMEELAIEPAMVDGTFRALLRTRGTPGAFLMRCATSVDAPRFVEPVRRRLRLG